MESKVTPKPPKRITGAEARRFTSNLINTWKPQSQVWPFQHGDDVTTGMSALFAWTTTFKLRKQLKLLPHGRMSCYIPAVGLAAFFTEVVHSEYISARILELNGCLFCNVSSASLIQLTLGVAYPLVVAPIIGFYMSDKLLTYPVPSITRAPRELFELWKKLVLKNPRQLCGVALAQMLVAAYITYEKHSFVWNNLVDND